MRLPCAARRFEIRIESAARLIAETIGTRGEDLAARLDAVSQQIDESLNVRGGALETNLTAIGERVGAVVETRMVRREHDPKSRRADRQRACDAHRRIPRGIRSASAGNSGCFNRACVGCSHPAGRHGPRCGLGHRGSGARVNDALHRTADTLSSTIDTRGRELDEALTARLGELQGTILERGGAIADRISKEVGSLNDTVTGRLVDLERMLTVEGKALADMVADKAREAGATINSQLEALKSRATQRTTEVAQSFDNLSLRVDQSLAARSTAINEALVQRTGEIARVMAEGGREVARALEVPCRGDSTRRSSMPRPPTSRTRCRARSRRSTGRSAAEATRSHRRSTRESRRVRESRRQPAQLGGLGASTSADGASIRPSATEPLSWLGCSNSAAKRSTMHSPSAHESWVDLFDERSRNVVATISVHIG